MREIKFRGWDNGKMRGPFEIGSASSERYYDCIEQYTGLKDKNGKEIYEGDIIKYPWLNHEFKGVVKWDDRRCYFYYSDKSFNGAENIEVIGNIHVNPELLEKAV